MFCLYKALMWVTTNFWSLSCYNPKYVRYWHLTILIFLSAASNFTDCIFFDYPSLITLYGRYLLSSPFPIYVGMFSSGSYMSMSMNLYWEREEQTLSRSNVSIKNISEKYFKDITFKVLFSFLWFLQHWQRAKDSNTIMF